LVFTLPRRRSLSLLLRSLVILSLALDFILFALDIAFVEFLYLDRFLPLFSIFPLRFYKSFDSIILRWSSEAQTIRCVGLYHLLNIIIFIFVWLGSKGPKLLFFRYWESFIIVEAIEVIENTLNLDWGTKSSWGGYSLGHWAWRSLHCWYWGFYNWNICLLNA
jgi:hypothetical protein